MTVNFEMYFIQNQLFKIKLGIKAAESKCLPIQAWANADFLLKNTEGGVYFIDTVSLIFQPFLSALSEPPSLLFQQNPTLLKHKLSLDSN